MPIKPTYPGVYVQELPSSVHTIMGVATSITAFVGQASVGTINQAVRVQSFTEYLRKFGAPDSELGYSVQQFFLNGGGEALVVRVGAGASSASLNLKSGTFDVLKVEARSQGVSGSNIQVTVTPQTGDGGLFDLRVEADGHPPETYSGLSMDRMSGIYAPDTLDTGSLIRLTDLTSKLAPLTDPRKSAQAELRSGPFTAADLSKPLIATADRDLRVSLDGGPFQNITLAQPTDITGAHLDTIVADIQQKIRDSNPVYKTFVCKLDGDHLLFQSGTQGILSRVTVATGLHHDAARALRLFAMNGAVSVPIAAKVTPSALPRTALAGGQDGEVAETSAVYFPETNTVVREGVFALEDIDLFNLLVLPGVQDIGVLQKAAQYCEQRRAMLLIDVPKSAKTPQEVQDVLAALTVSKNAAAYYPWVQLPNPNGGDPVSHPPSGTVAGLIARTDAARGVWKAPAGTEATLVNVQGLAYTLTDAENGLLNPLGVNCLRNFRTFGPVAWGARTRRGADDLTDQWKYLPVRRTALYIEESLFRGLKWVVFEPNDEPLWAQVRLNVGAFMHDLFRQGAFQGMTPRDAYLVKCDKETTTQNDVDKGVVNVLVGFAPLKPAEFVILQLQQLAGQLQV